jgi:hypothetical protein
MSTSISGVSKMKIEEVILALKALWDGEHDEEKSTSSDNEREDEEIEEESAIENDEDD